jgi:hypothetical protein
MRGAFALVVTREEHPGLVAVVTGLPEVPLSETLGKQMLT